MGLAASFLASACVGQVGEDTAAPQPATQPVAGQLAASKMELAQVELPDTVFDEFQQPAAPADAPQERAGKATDERASDATDSPALPLRSSQYQVAGFAPLEVALMRPQSFRNNAVFHLHGQAGPIEAELEPVGDERLTGFRILVQESKSPGPRDKCNSTWA